MNPTRSLYKVLALCIALAVGLGLAGCADEITHGPASGPGVDSPAAASGGDVIPSVGGAGNGGGISGGAAGVGSSGQGAR